MYLKNNHRPHFGCAILRLSCSVANLKLQCAVILRGMERCASTTGLAMRKRMKIIDINIYIHAWIHAFHGSTSVRQRQYDV